ncbi:MAG: hypothetical protein HY428_02300 [Candidatus Levybacteria bacterium]|nr:hypothetical protein [Candidatus Levybacteria bacterium]
MKEVKGDVGHTLRRVGQAATVIALAGGFTGGIYAAGQYVNSLEEQAIDARCGGVERKGCDKVERTVCRGDAGPWGGGFPYCGIVVEFASKTPTIDVIGTPVMQKEN